MVFCNAMFSYYVSFSYIHFFHTAAQTSQMPINNVNLTSVLPASIQQTPNHALVLTNSANGQCSSSDTSLSASSPSKSVKTSSSLSPAKRSSSGSPSKQSKTRGIVVEHRVNRVRLEVK